MRGLGTSGHQESGGSGIRDGRFVAGATGVRFGGAVGAQGSTAAQKLFERAYRVSEKGNHGGAAEAKDLMESIERLQ